MKKQMINLLVCAGLAAPVVGLADATPCPSAQAVKIQFQKLLSGGANSADFIRSPNDEDVYAMTQTFVDSGIKYYLVVFFISYSGPPYTSTSGKWAKGFSEMLKVVNLKSTGRDPSYKNTCMYCGGDAECSTADPTTRNSISIVGVSNTDPFKPPQQ